LRSRQTKKRVLTHNVRIRRPWQVRVSRTRYLTSTAEPKSRIFVTLTFTHFDTRKCDACHLRGTVVDYTTLFIPSLIFGYNWVCEFAAPQDIPKDVSAALHWILSKIHETSCLYVQRIGYQRHARLKSGHVRSRLVWQKLSARSLPRSYLAWETSDWLAGNTSVLLAWDGVILIVQWQRGACCGFKLAATAT
jgi:hypothetical protein